MKIVFLAREGLAARHIASKIASRHRIRVLWESGSRARARKLRRYFKGPFWTWPKAILDIGGALIYSRIVGSAAERELGPAAFASFEDEAHCLDANDKKANEILQTWAPDVVIVYGTALLNRKTLSLAPVFLNLHGGIVPKYRNVHSEFWALREQDTAGVGTSVLVVRPGIDDGSVAIQKGIAPEKAGSVHSAIVANVQLAGELALHAIELSQAGQSQFTPQLSTSSQSWPTPGFADLIRALIFKNPKL